MSNQAYEHVPAVVKQGYSLSEWCARWGLSRATAYNLIGKGKLKSVKVGRRRIVTAQQDRDFEQSLLKQAGEAA